MRSVWTAWFQFWAKQHLLHIDVLVFRNILNVQHRIELDKLPDGHLKLEFIYLFLTALI